MKKSIRAEVLSYFEFLGLLAVAVTRPRRFVRVMVYVGRVYRDKLMHGARHPLDS